MENQLFLVDGVGSAPKTGWFGVSKSCLGILQCTGAQLTIQT